MQESDKIFSHPELRQADRILMPTNSQSNLLQHFTIGGTCLTADKCLEVGKILLVKRSKFARKPSIPLLATTHCTLQYANISPAETDKGTSTGDFMLCKIQTNDKSERNCILSLNLPNKKNIIGNSWMATTTGYWEFTNNESVVEPTSKVR